MAFLGIAYTFIKKVYFARRLLASFTLIVLICAVVFVWTESYMGYGSFALIPNHKHTTAKFITTEESQSQQKYELSIEDKLLQAVNKLPFKVMPASSLMMEDLYFNPSTYLLVHYRNPILLQPEVPCNDNEFILIVVPSHPDSVGERKAIRETWGMVARGRVWPGNGNSYPVRLVFVLGISDPRPSSEPVESSTVKGNQLHENQQPFGKQMRSYSTENVTRILSHQLNQTTPQSFKANPSSANKAPKFAYSEGSDFIVNNHHYDTQEIFTKQTIKRRESESNLKTPTPTSKDQYLSVRNLSNGRISSILNQQTRSIKTTPKTTESSIMYEKSLFDDILQFDMIDSYSNLTRKIILSLRWSVQYCSSVKYILKVDPDVFVNVPLLTTFLRHYGETNSIYGHIYPNSLVERKGKWAVSKTALPIPKYPIYTAGNAYVLSKDAAVKIIHLAPHFPYVLVEDAFITGILASVGEVDRVFVGGFTKWTESRPDPCDFVKGKKYVGNNFTEYDHRLFWREIIDNGVTLCNN